MVSLGSQSRPIVSLFKKQANFMAGSRRGKVRGHPQGLTQEDMGSVRKVQGGLEQKANPVDDNNLPLQR